MYGSDGIDQWEPVLHSHPWLQPTRKGCNVAPVRFEAIAAQPPSLVQEFAGEDTTDLFLEEREASLRQAQEEKHKLQMSVPGILNPHELPEEMCD